MTGRMENVDAHLRNFRELDAARLPALERLRAEALERFSAVGFPTTRLEDWKFTDVSPLAKIPFRLAGAQPAPPAGALDAARVAGSIELVFVDGRHAPEHSRLGALPAGVRVVDLATALADDAEAVLAHLGTIARPENDPFIALNTAFVQHGAFVHLAKGAVLEAPIHLLFLAAQSDRPVIVHPRVLIVAEESSEASIIETWAGTAGTYCSNAVTEIALGPNAGVTHHRLQQESAGAFHVGTVAVEQARDSRLASHVVSIGAALVRVNVETALAAPGGACSLDGLYLAAGRQHVDHHTSIDHREPRCSSRELYKGVLDGHASAVFNGKVFVRPQAQKSDAGQVNKNLLLSRDAVIDSKPQLEIFADDVKCSHGATIGRLDPDALFFLRARGIGVEEARRVLIHAFANELIERVRCPAARSHLERAVGSRFRLDGAAA